MFMTPLGLALAMSLYAPQQLPPSSQPQPQPTPDLAPATAPEPMPPSMPASTPPATPSADDDAAAHSQPSAPSAELPASDSSPDDEDLANAVQASSPPVALEDAAVTTLPTDHRAWWLASGGGILVGSGVLAVGTALAAGGFALVVTPVAWGWATRDTGRFQPARFLAMAPSLVALMVAMALPIAGLVAVAADAAGFAWLATWRKPVGSNAVVTAALLTAVPGVVSMAASALCLTALLGLQATVGATSQGRRLPGDPRGRTFTALAASSVALGALGAGMVLAGAVARPAVAMVLDLVTR